MSPVSKNGLRTWLEIDKKAVLHNIAEFRKIIKPKTKLMAVVKSNAYGHGLGGFSKAAQNQVDWFGVDSIVEGLKLRQIGLKKPILVLGYTLPARLAEAAKNDISLTVSSFETLNELAKLKIPHPSLKGGGPKFHIKIDTGMHRQGFFVKDLPQVIKLLKRFKLAPAGVYTHFASAKDRLYPHYSLKQIETFKKADAILKKSGFQNYLRHASASAGAIFYLDAHFDMVRIGIGLYGMFSTRESEIQAVLPDLQNKQGTALKLKPALTWKSIISEIKDVPAGKFVGYDLTEKLRVPTRLAIAPIGYWHGFDRGLSSIGDVLVGGTRCKIIGRVSMDMITIDITNIDGKSEIPAYAKALAGRRNPKSLPADATHQALQAGETKVKIGDEVVLIGRQGKERITAEDIAQKIGTINYEVITRINPLIKRIYK